VEVKADVVKELPTAPSMGDEVSPASPWYHWYESGAALVTTTLNAAVWPALMTWLAGWVAMMGGLADIAATP